MTPSVFDSEMARLNENHRGFYTKTRTLAVWNTVREIRDDEFTTFVNKAIWFPKPPDMESFSNLVRNRSWSANVGGEIVTTYLNDEETREFWKITWDVMNKRIPEDEMNTRIQILETAIKYRKQGA